jgi:5-methylcytosine-specific restriction protein A
MKNPPWSRDEHIVALDFYLRYAPSIPDKSSVEIQELSRVLNHLHASISDERYDNFRNTNGVYMKLMNFRRFDPNYSGTGLANGSKDEELTWNLYADKPDLLSKIASNIRKFSLETKGSSSEESESDVEAEEGSILTKVHKYRERSRSLIQKKKEQHLRTNSVLACECCGFVFGTKYGALGDGFIECHHAYFSERDRSFRGIVTDAGGLHGER